MTPSREFTVGGRALSPARLAFPAMKMHGKRAGLFDRGLSVLVGPIAGCKRGFCFLARDAVDPSRIAGLSESRRPHHDVRMVEGGAGLANQLWRYACLRSRHLDKMFSAVPAWGGEELFGLRQILCRSGALHGAVA